MVLVVSCHSGATVTERRKTIRMSEEKVSYTQWLKRGTSTFIPTDNARTVTEIEAGVYNLRYTDNVGFYLYKKDLKLDELCNLKSKEGKEVMKSIRQFWSRRDKFKEYGYVYKRGILLYGPPGSGKTSIINLLCRELIEKKNGVVFILNTARDLRVYRDYISEIFRVIEPDRPIITIIEDIDGLCQHEETETTLINILDGIEQLENVVYLACPTPDTKILKSDLTWIQAGELKPGDELIGFDEIGPDRRYRSSIVNSCPIVQRKLYKVTVGGLEIKVSEGHPFLVNPGKLYKINKTRTPIWRQVEDLLPGDKILTIGKTWETDNTFNGGYISGQFDGEGCLFTALNKKTGAHGFKASWSQVTGMIAEKFEKLIVEYGFQYGKHVKVKKTYGVNGVLHKQKVTLNIQGGKWEVLRFLGTFRPERLLHNKNIRHGWDNCRLNPEYAIVSSIEAIGFGDVVALDTTTKTFIGEGLLQHNTTNYTEKLSERLLNRPNRFDRRVKIGFPTPKAREAYFKFKLKQSDIDIIDMKKWVGDTHGFTIAHLGELIKSVIILGNEFEETIGILKDLKTIPKSYDYNKELDRKSIGYGGPATIDDDYDDDEDYDEYDKEEMDVCDSVEKVPRPIKIRK